MGAGLTDVEREMGWKKLLSYITGSVDQELLLRNEYLVTENRMLRQQIPGHMWSSGICGVYGQGAQ